MHTLTIVPRTDYKTYNRPTGKIVFLKPSRVQRLKAIVTSHTGKLVYMTAQQ